MSEKFLYILFLKSLYFLLVLKCEEKSVRFCFCVDFMVVVVYLLLYIDLFY